MTNQYFVAPNPTQVYSWTPGYVSVLSQLECSATNHKHFGFVLSTCAERSIPRHSSWFVSCAAHYFKNMRMKEHRLMSHQRMFFLSYASSDV